MNCKRCYECQNCYGGGCQVCDVAQDTPQTRQQREPVTCGMEVTARLPTVECGSCVQCQVCAKCDIFGGIRTAHEQQEVCRHPQAMQNFSTRREEALKRHTMTKTGKHKITNLTVFPTEACNLRCTYCFNSVYGDALTNKTMTPEIVDRALWFMVEHSDPGERLSWHFFGGEPLVAFDVMQYTVKKAREIEKLSGRKFGFGITTNGTLIDDEVSSFLQAEKIQVLFSMDGWKESHDKHRIDAKGEGSFDRAIEGMKRVLKWAGKDGVPPMTLRWTIMPDTISSVPTDVQKYLELGVRTFATEPVYEVEWKKKDLDNYEWMLKQLGDIMIEHFRRGEVIEFKPIRDGMNLFRLKARFSMGELRCGLATSSLSLTADGKICRCHRFASKTDENYYLGDIWKGIDDVKCLELNMSHDIEKTRPADGRNCDDCPAKIICNAGCFAVNADTTGEEYVVPVNFCEFHVRQIREAVRVYSVLTAEKNTTFNTWMMKGRPPMMGRDPKRRPQKPTGQPRVGEPRLTCEPSRQQRP